jgi:hypothetical protein
VISVLEDLITLRQRNPPPTSTSSSSSMMAAASKKPVLTELLEKATKEEREGMIIRCLDLLKSFIEEFEERYRFRRAGAAQQNAAADFLLNNRTATLLIKSDKGTAYMVQIGTHDTAKTLRYYSF